MESVAAFLVVVAFGIVLPTAVGALIRPRGRERQTGATADKGSPADNAEVQQHFRSARHKTAAAGAFFLIFGLVDVGLHWLRQGTLGSAYWRGNGGLRFAALAALAIYAFSALLIRVTPEARQAVLEDKHRTRACPKCGQPAARGDITCKVCRAMIEPRQLVWLLYGVVLIVVVETAWRFLQ